jgi:Domain of unknown function (DUF5658)
MASSLTFSGVSRRQRGIDVHVLTAFVYLQLLDVLTTIAFMMHKVQEVNPLIKWAMRESLHPLLGLVLIKVAAILLAVLCVASSRYGVLRKINIFFAVLVAYNVVALILAAPVLHYPAALFLFELKYF